MAGGSTRVAREVCEVLLVQHEGREVRAAPKWTDPFEDLPRGRGGVNDTDPNSDLFGEACQVTQDGQVTQRFAWPRESERLFVGRGPKGVWN